MRVHFTFTLILIIAAYSLCCISLSVAQSFGTVYIRPNGSIEPTTAPILRSGDRYSLLDNLYNSPIVLEKNNIVFDGCGYALEGAKSAIAINITASNVTVQNLYVVNWEAGILGAYNNVTIQNCNLTGNEKGVAIYADNYRVEGNFIAQNKWGIRMQGNNVAVKENWLVGNSIGIWVSSLQGAYSGNIIVSNTFETVGKIAIETDLGGAFMVYHNNFKIPSNQGPIVQTAYLVVPGDESKVVMPPWDNGKEGNFWSNYKDKYSNAFEVGNTRIYDTPYVINIAPNLTDRYPLTKQIATPTIVLPRTSSQSPSPSAAILSTPSLSTSISPAITLTPNPSPTIPEFPAWITIPLALVSMLVIIYKRRGNSR